MGSEHCQAIGQALESWYPTYLAKHSKKRIHVICLLDSSREIGQIKYSFVLEGTHFTNSMKSKQKMEINNSTVCSLICFSISLTILHGTISDIRLLAYK